MEISNFDIAVSQLKEFFIFVTNVITWEQISILSTGIAVFFIFKWMYITPNKQKNASKTTQNEPKTQMQQKVRVDELYKRIHNITEDGAKQKASQQNHQDLQVKPRLNIHADSSYHHAIKLLRNGMDVQNLVEYCNLTTGEAELLVAIYRN